MNNTLDRISPYFPWVSLVLLFGGVIAYIVTRDFDLITNLLFGGGALLLLAFAVLRPDDVRALFARRQTRYGLSTVLSILFFTAIMVLIYWIAFQNDDWRADLTETGMFTPLDETQELLENLEEPIHVIGFFSVTRPTDQAETTLDSLQAISDNLTYEFQDPESNPLLAEQYELNFDGTLVFIRNQGQENEVFAKANSTNDNDIHSALVQVINPVEKTLYVITGHGEPAIEGQLPTDMGQVIAILEDQGFTIEELNLFTAGTIPEDADVVALVGQQAPLEENEVAAIADYLDGGGAVFIARDAVDTEGRLAAEEDGLNDILTQWGFTLRPDAVIDQDLAQAGQEFGLGFLGAEYGSSPIITEDVRRFGTRFTLARSIQTDETENIQHTPLIQTSESAWGEQDFELLSVGFAQPDGPDANGTLNIGVSAQNNNTGGRLVLFGDADWVYNDQLSWGGNGLLFVNSINWLAGDELSIDLTPRDVVNRQLNIPQTQSILLILISLCLSPLLIGIIGIVVYINRRRTR